MNKQKLSLEQVDVMLEEIPQDLRETIKVDWSKKGLIDRPRDLAVQELLEYCDECEKLLDFKYGQLNQEHFKKMISLVKQAYGEYSDK